MSEPSRPAYRPDIDGLRAVAVAAVILYHADVPGVSGGYVGVDVFFVISGYLITLLIVANAHLPARAQLAQFYVRRARRILPALLAVSAVTAIAACFVLLPFDLMRFARHLGSVPLLLTNVASWLNGSYFEAGLSQIALNHLWSIAVEEQFYLAYPALLLLIARYLPRRRLALLAAMAAVSLVLCIWGTPEKPVAAYYFAPTRAWELLLGAIVALCVPADRSVPMSPARRRANEVMALAGLGLVLFAICRYRTDIGYPGWYALVPCSATALLIAAGPGTYVARLLASRPLVFTGLISYSLYLWHWPIFSLSGYYMIAPTGWPTRGLLIVATYLLACSSWQLIERPIRSRRWLASNRSFVRVAILASLALLATAATLWGSGGWPQRFPWQVLAATGVQLGPHPDAIRCTRVPPEKIRDLQLCRFGPDGAHLPRVLVWGDSHALALLPAYEHLAWAHRVQLYFAPTSPCGPSLGVADGRNHRMWSTSCSQFNQSTMTAVRKLDPQLVILGGYWSYIATRIEPENHSRGTHADTPHGALLPAGGSLFREGLERTLRQISAAGRTTCIVLDVPTVRQVVPYALAMAERRGIPPDMVGVTRSQALRDNADVESDIRALQARWQLQVADPKDALCDGDRCRIEAGGQPLYRDRHHLSTAGARLVTSSLEPCFAELAGSEGGH